MSLSNKQLSQIRQQMRKQVLALDDQIYELEMYYIEDTRQTGNLIKGFDNYMSARIARNQPTIKKNRVENFQRLFSLSSIKSKTSQTYEECMMGQKNIDKEFSISNYPQKRPRARNAGGLNKSSGKQILPQDDFVSNSEVSGDNIYSRNQSNNAPKNPGKKKKRIIRNTKGKRNAT